MWVMFTYVYNYIYPKILKNAVLSSCTLINMAFCVNFFFNNTIIEAVPAGYTITRRGQWKRSENLQPRIIRSFVYYASSSCWHETIPWVGP